MVHYEVEPDLLQPHVPFPLDLFRGRAYVSAVAFTLADLAFFSGGPAFSTHRFLNIRTYVEGNGIYFLSEYLTNPFCVFLGPRLYGLPYRWGRLDYRHRPEEGLVEGRVRGREGTFAYEGRTPRGARPGPAAAGSLDEFLLERYTAFTRQRKADRLFHVWHRPWTVTPLELDVRDESLLAAGGPWFAASRRIAAHASPGFAEVWMGRPERRVS
jgi:hypothetical protein